MNYELLTAIAITIIAILIVLFHRSFAQLQIKTKNKNDNSVASRSLRMQSDDEIITGVLTAGLFGIFIGCIGIVFALLS